MKRSELIANVALGGCGTFGQGVLLAHTLDSYPFVILMSPPERFYSLAGWTLAVVAPLLSLLLLFVFQSTLRPFVTAIPVVACPLVFWLLFRLTFFLSGYHYAPVGRGTDLIATGSIENGFSALVVSLTFAGLVIGVICGLVLWLVFKGTQTQRLA